MRARKPLQVVVAIAVTLQSFVVPTYASPPILNHLSRAYQEAKYHGKKPKMGRDSAIELLAENIDWLEHHIDRYGSVTAKQPDVWGEARLTKHRDEFEQMMFRELNQFSFRINASIEQSDSSFLSQSMALSAAASGQSVPKLPTTKEITPKAADSAAVDLKKFGQEKIDIEPTIFLDQLSRYLQHLHELRRINEGDDTSDSPGYSLNLVRVPVSILPGKLTRTGYGAEITMSIEPVVTEDLLPTTFRNLVINDLVSQLGLPLVRLTEQYPEVAREYENSIALLDLIAEASRVRQAFAYALSRQENEVDIPEDADRLTEAFKEIVDAVLTFPPGDVDKLPAEAKEQFISLRHSVEKLQREIATDVQDQRHGGLEEKMPTPQNRNGQGQITPQVRALFNNVVNAQIVVDDALKTADQLAVGISTKFSGQAAPAGRTRQAKHPISPSQIEAVYGMDELLQMAKILCKSYSGRHIRWSGAPCCDCDNDGIPCKTGSCKADRRVNLIDARKFLQAEIDAAYELLADPAHVQLWYRLAKPDSGLAAAIRRGHLRTRNHGFYSVQNFRELFFYSLHRYTIGDEASRWYLSPSTPRLAPRQPRSMRVAHNPVEALAWAVVVESALLNQRLNEDVRKIAVAKQCYELQTDREHSFFLPESLMRPMTVSEDRLPADGEVIEASAEAAHPMALREEYQLATEVFRQYVLCRWPIHVFAVDPVAQDQNVADASKRKRELQFALSLAFVTGQIGGNTLTQFSRDLQTEINTIALNRTAAGFAHGPDTFGWRFHPRVQGLDVPGTAGALWQTIRGTPRDADIRKRRLEPGMRECVAIVLMPSFVPYVDTQVRSNWFKLTNPKKAAVTMKDTMQLSRAITTMRNSRLECIRCAHLYRPGEVERLLGRVKQLDRELPLQTMRVQVPYENTRGGFEMFNSGATDLAPELVGWHGAPGVVIGQGGTNEYACGCSADCKEGARALVGAAAAADKKTKATTKATPMPVCYGKGTSLFLVGDNFSVHDTRVIAGGVCIPHVQLISRQIMRITIPTCVNTVCVENKEYVALHVATPYGVTNHLHIPVHRRGEQTCELEEPTPAEPSAFDPNRLQRRSVFQPAHETRTWRVRRADAATVSWDQPIDEDVTLIRLPPVDRVAVPSVPNRRDAVPTVPTNHRLRHADGQWRLRSVVNRAPTRFVQSTGDVTGTQPTPEPKLPPIQVETPVQVNVFVTEEEKKLSELEKRRKHPLLNRMKTHVRESWRNCRDKLPGN